MAAIGCLTVNLPQDTVEESRRFLKYHKLKVVSTRGN